MDKLLKYIRSLTDFKDESWDMLKDVLSPEEFNKKEFLLKEGQIANSLFYVTNGYCRSFYVIDGTEINTHFFFENDIAGHLSRSENPEKSGCSIVACEPLSCIRIDKDKLVKAAHNNLEIERMGRFFIRDFAAQQDEFSRINKLYKAEDRLAYLEKNHPEMMKRIPLIQLASFLGTARETLSRIRKQRTRNRIL